MRALIGIKKGMTRVFVGDKVVPVTIIDVNGCLLARKEDKGFELGIGTKKKANKALTGKYKGLESVPMHRKYFTGVLSEEKKVGEVLTAGEFKTGDEVTINGVSKGKGFAGVVKRHDFAGGPKTHGQSDRWRAPGSIGAGTTPGRVFKGKRMAGRMGQDSVTVKGKQIIDIKDSYLLISGPIPGSNGDLIAIYNEQ